MDEAFQVEARGAAEGINPMFGEWRQEFEIEPVSYANPGAARGNFRRMVREQLKNKFVFVGSVWMTVTLYLDEQKVLETPAYGDLDNHAKQLLDSLKGKGGVLIDDCQVQRLDISWVDVPYGARFEIEIKASPDDFLPEPIKLFEMPDGLFYPISNQIWTADGLVAASESSVLVLAQALASMTKAKKNLRHKLRQEGVPQFRAFQFAKYVSPVLTGFHRSRVVDSGYTLVEHHVWNQRVKHDAAAQADA
jgi:Holliday junction resolvase RusA-like endonuclease